MFIRLQARIVFLQSQKLREFKDEWFAINSSAPMPKRQLDISEPRAEMSWDRNISDPKYLYVYLAQPRVPCTTVLIFALLQLLYKNKRVTGYFHEIYIIIRTT